MVTSLFKPTTYGTHENTDKFHTSFHLGTLLDWLTSPWFTALFTIPCTLQAIYALVTNLMFHQHDYIVKAVLMFNSCILSILCIISVFYLIIICNHHLSESARHVPWENEIALITGGASGVGWILANRLADKGVAVFIVDIMSPKDSSTLLSKKASPGKIKYYQCDITDAEAVKSIILKIEEEIGSVSILINNAGICKANSLLESSVVDIKRAFEVNVISHFHTIQAVLPGMINKRYGHVMTVASTMGLSGVANMTHYCGSKFAAVGLHESFRQELLQLPFKHLIHTTLICPGLILTGMFDGIQIKLPFVVPPLTPDQVVDQMLTALTKTVQMSPDEIIENKKFKFSDHIRLHKVIWTPTSYYLSSLLSVVAPVVVTDFVKQILGANTAITKNFKGRRHV